MFEKVVLSAQAFSVTHGENYAVKSLSTLNANGQSQQVLTIPSENVSILECLYISMAPKTPRSRQEVIVNMDYS